MTSLRKRIEKALQHPTVTVLALAVLITLFIIEVILIILSLNELI